MNLKDFLDKLKKEYMSSEMTFEEFIKSIDIKLCSIEVDEEDILHFIETCEFITNIVLLADLYGTITEANADLFNIEKIRLLKDKPQYLKKFQQRRLELLN